MHLFFFGVAYPLFYYASIVLWINPQSTSPHPFQVEPHGPGPHHPGKASGGGPGRTVAPGADDGHLFGRLSSHT